MLLCRTPVVATCLTCYELRAAQYGSQFSSWAIQTTPSSHALHASSWYLKATSTVVRIAFWRFATLNLTLSTVFRPVSLPNVSSLIHWRSLFHTPFNKTAKVLLLSSACCPKTSLIHPVFVECQSLAVTLWNVMIVSPLGILRAAIAPFFKDAWLTAWMVFFGVRLARSAGVSLALTRISLFTRAGTILSEL